MGGGGREGRRNKYKRLGVSNPQLTRAGCNVQNQWGAKRRWLTLTTSAPASWASWCMTWHHPALFSTPARTASSSRCSTRVLLLLKWPSSPLRTSFGFRRVPQLFGFRATDTPVPLICGGGLLKEPHLCCVRPSSLRFRHLNQLS